LNELRLGAAVAPEPAKDESGVIRLRNGNPVFTMTERSAPMRSRWCVKAVFCGWRLPFP